MCGEVCREVCEGFAHQSQEGDRIPRRGEQVLAHHPQQVLRPEIERPVSSTHQSRELIGFEARMSHERYAIGRFTEAVGAKGSGEGLGIEEIVLYCPGGDW